jgi:signal transduction histidine kinase
MIKRSAYRAGGVVQRLLDFARPAQYNMQLLDINQSVQSAVSMVRAQVEPHLAHIKLDLTPDLPQVIASEQHLEDIWINLLLNARDAVYGRENSVIEITSRLDYEGTTIAVSIRDNGVGIAPEQLPHVFDPLFTTKTHGTGLGLSICQEIAIRHGGTIEVISQPDWGAEFIVRLPLKR